MKIKLLMSCSMLFLYFSIGHPAFSQINEIEISFEQYEENYSPLIHGDTLFGKGNEEWGTEAYETVVVSLDPGVNVSGLDNLTFKELWVISSGGYGFFHFDEEDSLETFMVLAGGLPLNSYCSALLDPENTDQSLVIYQRDSGYIRVEFQNVAIWEELDINDGSLDSRFNFQLEYRESDSRVRFLYGPSVVTNVAADFIENDFLLTYFGFEVSGYDEFGFWDWLDVNSIALIGLAQSPELFIPQNADSWPPRISLVNFPPEGTVYQFNVGPGTSTSELDPFPFQWDIYPNPSNETISIDTGSQIDMGQEFNVKIFSITGKLLFSKKINGSDDIDIDFLNSGTYIVHLLSERYYGTKKLVKN